jgi:hypothetical protein
MDPVTTRWRARLADKMENIWVYRSRVDFAVSWSQRVLLLRVGLDFVPKGLKDSAWVLPPGYAL